MARPGNSSLLPQEMTSRGPASFKAAESLQCLRELKDCASLLLRFSTHILRAFVKKGPARLCRLEQLSLNCFLRLHAQDTCQNHSARPQGASTRAGGDREEILCHSALLRGLHQKPLHSTCLLSHPESSKLACGG